MTKIDIISGFLGAGKTTLIKKLLSEAFAGEQVVGGVQGAGAAEVDLVLAGALLVVAVFRQEWDAAKESLQSALTLPQQLWFRYGLCLF